MEKIFNVFMIVSLCVLVGISLNQRDSWKNQYKNLQNEAILRGYAEIYVADPNSIDSPVIFKWKE